MRPIKFRVWDRLAELYISPERGYKYHHIISLDGMYENLQNGSSGKNGDEFDIEQFTGLLDKNGVEIYEGDIARYKLVFHLDEELEWILPVRFQNGAFSPIPVNDIIDEDDWYSSRIKDYEIIGNIHQNPELLNN